MSSNATFWPGVHFNQSYIDFQYNWNHFSTYLAIIPWFYMLPSFVIICKILKFYKNSEVASIAMKIDRNVLFVISLSQLICFCLFFFDFLMVRLPATGIISSFCASIAPNHWLKLILFLALYFTYLAMAFPFLVPVVPILIVLFPNTHNSVTHLDFSITFLVIFLSRRYET